MLILVAAACAAKPPAHVSPDEGLRAVLEASRAGRIIGLGEVQHGSGAIAEIRATWTRALLEDGARVLAIEGPYTGGLRLQAWLDGGCEGDTPAEMALELLHPAWTDVTTSELLAWMCEQPPGLRIIGFDNQDPHAHEHESEAARIAVTALEAQLAASGIEAIRIRDEAMAKLLRLQLDPTERTVVWAHSNHLNEASDQTSACKPGSSWLCKRHQVRLLGTWIADDFDVLTVAMTATELEQWGPDRPTVWRAPGAEHQLPEHAWLPLSEPWTATIGATRGDLSLAFDAILTVPPGRAILPVQALRPMAKGEQATWSTYLPPAEAEAVVQRALAQAPWTGVVATEQEEGWTRVTITPR